jgi:hypothetical protein
MGIFVSAYPMPGIPDVGHDYTVRPGEGPDIQGNYLTYRGITERETAPLVFTHVLNNGLYCERQVYVCMSVVRVWQYSI